MRINLAWYDWIVVNSSAGKDSQVMLHKVVKEAEARGLKHKVVVVHADLGRVEWKGTKELAKAQADHYGVRFEVVRRTKNDLLDHVLERRMWPSSTARYCTSDHKRGPVATLFTKLVKESKLAGVARKVRILNCLGFRAQESPARSKRPVFVLDRRLSGTVKKVGDQTIFKPGRTKTVHVWLPIHELSLEQVWETIHESGVPFHRAYSLGMPRLSCCFCIFAPKKALQLAAKHNPELHAEYIKVEKEIGHTFRKELAIADIVPSDQGGGMDGPVENWCM